VGWVCQDQGQAEGSQLTGSGPGGGTVTHVDAASGDQPDGDMHVDGFARWTLRDIAPLPERVSYVRQQVTRVLEQWKLHDLVVTVELAISELVTNVVRHAHTPFTVALAWDGHRLRGEVIDVNPGQPLPDPHPDLDQLGGRGLFMVQQLVTTWGWHSHSRGKVVYFEVVGTRSHSTGSR
jgi:anti-sigma regulatory factor (Ser/Thr protein kinase)